LANFREHLYRVSIIGLALVMMIASGLKAYSLSQPIDMGINSMPVPVIVISGALEFAVSITILLRLAIKYEWEMLLSCYVLFSGISLYSFLTGMASCGCFGVLKAPPLVMLIFDLFAVLLLLFQRQNQTTCLRERPTTSQNMRISAGVIASFTYISTVLFLTFSQPQMKIAGYSHYPDLNITVLMPQEWLGTTLPIISDIEGGDILQSGDWVVFLYNPTCPACMKSLNSYYSENISQMESPPKRVFFVSCTATSQGLNSIVRGNDVESPHSTS